MLIVESHQYGGTWVFYVIAPVILFGIVACLWWIVKGSDWCIRPRVTGGLALESCACCSFLVHAKMEA
jgi:hypothetical protein